MKVYQNAHEPVNFSTCDKINFSTQCNKSMGINSSGKNVPCTWDGFISCINSTENVNVGGQGITDCVTCYPECTSFNA